LLSHLRPRALETNLSNLPRAAAFCQCGFLLKSGANLFCQVFLDLIRITSTRILRSSDPTTLVDRSRPRLRSSQTRSTALHSTRKNTRASAGQYSIGLKNFFEDFLKYPSGNPSSRIEPRRFCLGGDSSGFALDDLESQSIQSLSPTAPAPSLHITAAATSLTSFINVPSQPESRKGHTPFSRQKNGHALAAKRCFDACCRFRLLLSGGTPLELPFAPRE
jgi:hypothetical protein